jgi:hypothetical protein
VPRLDPVGDIALRGQLREVNHLHALGRERDYARVSTIDQNLELQETALRTSGCAIIRSEKRSGTLT